VYAVLIDLTLLLRQLPTALQQATTWLDTEYDAGRIGRDNSENVTLTVHCATISLHDAIQHTRPLQRTLTLPAPRPPVRRDHARPHPAHLAAARRDHSGNPADSPVDPGWRFTMLGAWGPRAGAILITGSAAAGLLVTATMIWARTRLPKARFPRVLATLLGHWLAVAVPDHRLIALVAYTVMVLPASRCSDSPGSPRPTWQPGRGPS
jgi:hypothetical protein